MPGRLEKTLQHGTPTCRPGQRQRPGQDGDSIPRWPRLPFDHGLGRELAPAPERRGFTQQLEVVARVVNPQTEIAFGDAQRFQPIATSVNWAPLGYYDSNGVWVIDSATINSVTASLSVPTLDLESAAVCLHDAPRNRRDHCGASLESDAIPIIRLGGITMTPLAAVKRVLGDDLHGASMSSTKSAIGHLLGGAGAVEAIFCILAIRDQIVPPTLNLDDPDEGTEGVDLVPHKAKKRPVRAVLNNSFGFGGTNASLIMKAV